MKKLLLFALFIPAFTFGQTRTSTAAGDFINPLNWNPMGVPASGDSLIVNHAMVMTTDIYYTSGRITITPNGSLVEDATDRNFWADGTGSVVNSGTFTTHLLALSPMASFTNNGDFINIDSLWNQGTVINSPGGYATLNDFWNDQTGTFTNSGVLSNADSLLNQGSFINNTSASVNALLNDQMANFTNNGNLEITSDMNNQGPAFNNASMVVYNNFSNCNTQTMDAIFTNNGRLCIANDFLNCAGDTLTGTGSYYVGGLSSNLGVFDGTHIFYTTSGSLDIQGNVQPGVTIMAGTCNLGLESIDMEFEVYPNPTSANISLTITNVNYELFDITGKVVMQGMVANHTIETRNLRNGIYLLKVEGQETKRIVKH